MALNTKNNAQMPENGRYITVYHETVRWAAGVAGSGAVG